MPSTYAHARLGNDAEKCADEKIKGIIERNRDCYSLGLHGPDLLFYFKPLTANKINAIGYGIHERFASEFFKRAKDIFEKRGKREADEAYLLGFLCHFALDSEGHPIVNAEMKDKNISHTEIETAFDRHLLLKDGKDPFGTDLTAHIKDTEQTRSAAAAYFNVTEKQAEKAIRSIKFYNKLINSDGKFTRGMVTLLLKISGNWKLMHGTMLPLELKPAWQDGINGLSAAYENAVKKAARLMENYDGYLCGNCALSAELDRDFE